MSIGYSAAVAEPVDLSIVILNWNGREMLRNLLASIVAMPDELRGADDRRRQRQHRRLGRHGRGRLSRRRRSSATGENLGFARGNNAGAAIATGRNVLFLNNDMIVRPGALSRLVAFLDSRLDSPPSVRS